MVNSVRTALLNLGAWPGADAPAAEEYVPAEYVPRRLTGALAAARGLLFGAGADRVGMNVTLARLVAYLHASRFAPDVTADDPRVTYDPAAGPAVYDRIGPAVTGPATAGWTGSATFPAPGRAYGAWRVVTDGAGGYAVTPDGAPAATGPVAAADTGDAVPMPGSNLGLVVPTGAAGTWGVTLLVPPGHAFTALAGLADAAALFRPSGNDLDRKWYAAWGGTGPAYERAAAAALALAARTLELGA